VAGADGDRVTGAAGVPTGDTDGVIAVGAAVAGVPGVTDPAGGGSGVDDVRAGVAASAIVVPGAAVLRAAVGAADNAGDASGSWVVDANGVASPATLRVDRPSLRNPSLSSVQPPVPTMVLEPLRSGTMPNCDGLTGCGAMRPTTGAGIGVGGASSWMVSTPSQSAAPLGASV
jgi:hypothetical protein